MCLYPKLIQNKKYTKNKKNGGIIPAFSDNRVLAVPVGCGRCMECKKQEANKWRIRLFEEIKENNNGKFITLTFSNESIIKLTKEIKDKTIKGYELDNEIARIAIRRFLERWRKKHKTSVKHWFTTELGNNGTENIHLHGIIFTNKSNEEIKNIWKYGYIWPKDNRQTYVNETTINYITKYITKTDIKHKEYKNKILCSPGIGKRYINGNIKKRNKYKENQTIETYKTKSGHNIALPIYYRNYIYSEDEREKLWIEKLNKNKRYINGNEVDVSKGMDDYYKLLKEAQIKNKRLGYGSNEKNWKQQKYEKERRRILQEKRYTDNIG